MLFKDPEDLALFPEVLNSVCRPHYQKRIGLSAHNFKMSCSSDSTKQTDFLFSPGAGITPSCVQDTCTGKTVFRACDRVGKGCLGWSKTPWSLRSGTNREGGLGGTGDVQSP